MKKNIVLCIAFVLSCFLCIAEQNPSEDEVFIEKNMGTSVWNIVKAPGESMKTGMLQFEDFEKNIINFEMFLTDYSGMFIYDSVEQYTNETFLIHALSDNGDFEKEVYLLFDFRDYPESIIIKEYMYDDLINTFFLNQKDEN